MAFEKKSRRVLKQVEATMDSGSSVTVVPVDCCDEYKTRPSQASERGVSYTAAGGEKIDDLGCRKLDAITEEGERCSLEASVAKVKKALVSVAKVVDKGNIVRFGPNANDNYILNLKSQKKTKIKRKGDTFKLMLSILEPEYEQKSIRALETIKEESNKNMQNPNDRSNI